MAYAEIEEVLKQAMGLDAASIGSLGIELAVHTRVSACRLENPDAYLKLVRSSAAELQALIEAVVVPETWFFRDREAFAAMARMAQEEWLRAHPEGTLRLLSLPCSTGEEPYSMAMALLDGGFGANRFRIDAVDISARALEHARHGEYGKNSFRGVELGFRNTYFEATAHGYRLSGNVRRQVAFAQGNMFAPDFLPGSELYDMIFCRNLLIYFDRATQDRAVGLLSRLLTARGVLFVAPSETGLLLDHGFVSAQLPLAFAFRKTGAVPRTHGRTPVHPIRQTPSVPARRGFAPPAANPSRGGATSKRAPQASAPAAPAASPSPPLDEASRLADQGRVVEAAKCCEEHLRKHGPSVDAFHLLGLIRAAAGNLKEADQYYRKALYLDPTHQGTLVHLAFLLEEQGNAAAAHVLRNRLSRLKVKSAN